MVYEKMKYEKMNYEAMRIKKPVRIQAIRKPLEVIETEPELADSDQGQHEILAEFDAKKAVIYSEIFKRPQY